MHVQLHHGGWTNLQVVIYGDSGLDHLALDARPRCHPTVALGPRRTASLLGSDLATPGPRGVTCRRARRLHVAAHARRWHTRTNPRHRSCRITRWADITRLRRLLESWTPRPGTVAETRRDSVKTELRDLEEAFLRDAESTLTPWVRPRNVDVRSRVA